MSRFGDYDGEYQFPNQYEFWQANLERALKGKRGRKVLADLREALMALPQPRLIERAMCTIGAARRAAGYPEKWLRGGFMEDVAAQGEGVCAGGAYLWYQRVKAGVDPAEAFDSLPTLSDLENEDTGHATAAALNDAGVVYCLASALAYRNDETFEGMTPEERWTAFVAWIDQQLARPVMAR